MLEDPYVEVALQAPPSPDYIPGPEEPKQVPPSPDYIPGPEHTDDEILQYLCQHGLIHRYEVGESSSAAAARPAGGFRADYGIVTTIDREIMQTLQGAPVSTDTELGRYVREFKTRVRQDTDEIYMRLDDKQTERQLLAGRLNMLFRDRHAHTYTRQLMETEARMVDVRDQGVTGR
nr:hypothetical protein [Tanacetum cinerariifolium]